MKRLDRDEPRRGMESELAARVLGRRFGLADLDTGEDGGDEFGAEQGALARQPSRETAALFMEPGEQVAGIELAGERGLLVVGRRGRGAEGGQIDVGALEVEGDLVLVDHEQPHRVHGLERAQAQQELTQIAGLALLVEPLP